MYGYHRPPLAIQKVYNLQFGSVAAGSIDGTVVMSPAGVRTASGGVTLSNVNHGTAASFSVTGDSNATYAITLPASVVLSNGSNTMVVDTFTSEPSGTGQLSSGSQTLRVGATLHVAADQAPGSYEGTFEVSVSYN